MKKFSKGQRFRALDDVTVTVLVHWRATLTTGRNGVLLRGTVVGIEHDQAPRSTGCTCLPVRYEELEADLVDRSDREDAGYAGYSVVISHGDLASKFKRIA